MFSLNCNWPLTGATLLGFQFTLHNTVMVLFTKCNSNHFILYYPALRVYRIKCKLLRKYTKICIYLVVIYQSVDTISQPHFPAPHSSVISHYYVPEVLHSCPFLCLEWPPHFMFRCYWPHELLFNVVKLKPTLCVLYEVLLVLTPKSLIILSPE